MAKSKPAYKGRDDVEEERTSSSGFKKNSSNKKNSNPRRNSKSSNKDRKTTSQSRKAGSGDTSSDISEFLRAGQLTKDTSTFSTFTAAGLPLYGVELENYTPSGIARYDYVPYFGYIDSVTHPLNTAAKILYDLINAKNSRNTSYDPSDLMLYVIAVGNAWSLYSWVTRIVGMFNTFTTANRYWWTPLAQAIGITKNSSANDIVKWRNLANRMALKLNMLPVPGNIGYFTHIMKMPARIYADSPTMKASLSFFNPAAFLKYGYDEETGTGKLTVSKFIVYGVNGKTPQEVENYFDSLTENLFNDSAINLIGSDIIKAIGEENVFRMPQLDESFQIFYEYDPRVNLTIHNAVIYDRIYANGAETGTDVYQNYTLEQNMQLNCIVGGVQVFPAAFRSNMWMVDNRSYGILLDFPYDDPSHEDFIRATRLTGYVDNLSHLHGCTELLVRGMYYHFTDNDGLWSISHYDGCTNLAVSPTSMSATSWLGTIKRLDLVTKFHDSPIVRVITGNENAETPYLNFSNLSIVEDLTNPTTLSRAELENMNKACQLSVFSPIDLG